MSAGSPSARLNVVAGTPAGSSFPGRESEFREVVDLIRGARQRALQAVNTSLVALYWEVGRYMSQKLQVGVLSRGSRSRRAQVTRKSIHRVLLCASKDNEVVDLVAAQERTARTARELFSTVEKARDQPTADLLTQRLEVHEKAAWMVRSLLEDWSLVAKS